MKLWHMDVLFVLAVILVMALAIVVSSTKYAYPAECPGHIFAGVEETKTAQIKNGWIYIDIRDLFIDCQNNVCNF